MKNSRILVLVDDAPLQHTRRSTAEVPSRQDVQVPPSPENLGFNLIGGKCAHGVYIPGDVSGDHARDCSVCHPFEIITKKNADFRA